MAATKSRRWSGPRGGLATASRLSSLLALLALVTAASACRGSDVEEGIDEQEIIDVGQAVVGSCLRFDDDVGETVSKLPVTACDEPHTHEIFAVISSGEDVYPGFEALDEIALVECLGAFKEYVGTNPFESSLFASWLVPSLGSWNDEDKKDRETICVVGSNDAEPLTDTVKGRGL